MNEPNRELYNKIVEVCLNSGLSALDIIGVLELAKLQIYNDAVSHTVGEPIAK